MTVYISYIDDNNECGQLGMIKHQNQLVIETVEIQSLVRLKNTVELITVIFGKRFE